MNKQKHDTNDTEAKQPASAGCLLELEGLDEDIRSYFIENIPARYVSKLPSQIQICRNQLRLLHHLCDSQNSADNSENAQNDIQPQNTIRELVRCFQVLLDGGSDLNCDFGDQRALDLFVKLGVRLGILFETGHDLANGHINVRGRFAGHSDTNGSSNSLHNNSASAGCITPTCSAALVAEIIEYATNQKKQCLSDSVDREQNDDASGSAYYKGLAVAYAQMAQRVKCLLPNANVDAPAHD